ncbi:MAG: hypothetical protein MUE53_09695 [Chitinophagales bacterium]|nr:hypothetical protein [Chitinophagales bacterium]
MAKYQNGASVQGIQDFIFKTNKLQEIIGASEIVEQICKKWFFEVSNKEDSNLILSAAGNIKYLFDNEDDCKLVVKSFPKFVMEKAPGITISQAVVELSGESYTYDDIKKLEENLKTQRSKPQIPLENGYMAVERARRTGGVVLASDKDNNDLATIKKLEAKDNKALFETLTGETIGEKEMPLDLKDMTKSGSNSWIAVIHADGNGLGKILQNYGKELIANKEFKEFSNSIQNATEAACKDAYDTVIKENLKVGDKKIPIRPIIIGGDDVTIIIRADLALDFTNQFLKSFEKESKRHFENLTTKQLDKGLTACAGICYVKDSYPLHYALKLSEELCKDAKKLVKKDITTWKDKNYLPKSSLAIFKVMDSFVEPLEDMKKRTMNAEGNIDYYAGPYWIEEAHSPNVTQLKDMMKKIEEESKNNKDGKDSKGVSKIRQLISESFVNIDNMKIMKERMKEMNSKLYEDLKLDENLKENSSSILYDIINLHGFKY